MPLAPADSSPPSSNPTTDPRIPVQRLLDFTLKNTAIGSLTEPHNHSRLPDNRL